MRVSFLSGDVHCAAVGVFETLQRGVGLANVPPAQDHRYMLNIVTSAIVNTPYVYFFFSKFFFSRYFSPPPAVIALVASRANKKHKTMHHGDTDESMVKHSSPSVPSALI
jgi:hypothetical protein